MDRIIDACLKCGQKGELFGIPSFGGKSETKFFCHKHFLERGGVVEEPAPELFSDEEILAMVEIMDDVEIEEEQG